MRYEVETELESTNEAFKANTLINNPELYFKIWPENQQPGVPDFAAEEIIAPESEAELKSMLAEMQRQGLID